MIEVIPVMLFILGWHPDRPGEIYLEREEIVFFSSRECESEGAQLSHRKTEAARDKGGTRYEHRCIPIPSHEEFERAYKKRAPGKP